jgi:hypothetical protein
MSLSTWSRRGKLVLLGALSFWLPDTLLHAARGYDFAGLDAIFLTVGLPLACLPAYLWARRLYGRSALAAPWMLLGVWMLGGFFMQVGASFSGGGFAAGALSDLTVSLLLCFFPPATFMMSAYDGSLFALFLVTGLATVLWIVEATRRTVRPPAPSPGH